MIVYQGDSDKSGREAKQKPWNQVPAWLVTPSPVGMAWQGQPTPKVRSGGQMLPDTQQAAQVRYQGQVPYSPTQLPDTQQGYDPYSIFAGGYDPDNNRNYPNSIQFEKRTARLADYAARRFQTVPPVQGQPRYAGGGGNYGNNKSGYRPYNYGGNGYFGGGNYQAPRWAMDMVVWRGI